MRCALAILPALLASPALADLSVSFVDGAPVDRFTFSPTGGCPIGPATLVVDLRGSQGRLIFDTTASGAGVSVYQPFRLTSGEEQVISAPQVRDGASTVTLSLSELNTDLSFTIDVDDTIGMSETRVSGSEITGAEVALDLGGIAYRATFDEQSQARLKLPACVS